MKARFRFYLVAWFVFFIMFSSPIFPAEECVIGDMPIDPCNTYCQAYNFVKVGPSRNIEILCEDNNYECMNFLLEKYRGVRSCCTDSNCMNCLPMMSDSGSNWMWQILTLNSNSWYCDNEDYFPEYIKENCLSPNLIQYIRYPPVTFCGNCDDGDAAMNVCVAFTAIFNPMLAPNYVGPTFDGFVSDCWNTCGDNMDVLMWCNTWQKCGDPGCVAL